MRAVLCSELKFRFPPSFAISSPELILLSCASRIANWQEFWRKWSGKPVFLIVARVVRRRSRVFFRLVARKDGWLGSTCATCSFWCLVYHGEYPLAGLIDNTWRCRRFRRPSRCRRRHREFLNAKLSLPLDHGAYLRQAARCKNEQPIRSSLGDSHCLLVLSISASTQPPSKRHRRAMAKVLRP